MKISILTISYNSERTIGTAIRSVNNQTYSDIEHVFVDGASDDATTQIISECSNRRTKLLSECDSGIYEALNKGIRLCSGDYVLLLHSDDELYDQYTIQDCVEELGQHNYPEILSGSVIQVHPNKPNQNAYVYKSTTFRHWKLKYGFQPAHNATFVKRAVYEDLEYNPVYISAGDFDWFYRLYQTNVKCIYTSRIVAIQRLGGTSSSGIKSVIRTSSEQLRIMNCGLFSFQGLKLLVRIPIKYIWRTLASRHIDNYK
jgi:glycosyltransferase involved in cell wall biosynthesis